MQIKLVDDTDPNLRSNQCQYKSLQLRFYLRELNIKQVELVICFSFIKFTIAYKTSTIYMINQFVIVEPLSKLSWQFVFLRI